MRLRNFLNSKIYYATVLQTELHYQGSITIDKTILSASGISETEQVEVLNLDNGARFRTYVIPGESDSGMICLNGPAARQATVGDKIIVLSYILLSEDELAQHKTKHIELNESNKIVTATLR